MDISVLTMTVEVYMLAGFGVLMVANMKMAIFWVVTVCSLVEVYQCFRGTCCLHHQADDEGSTNV
jgi:hypothetical protein